MYMTLSYTSFTLAYVSLRIHVCMYAWMYVCVSSRCFYLPRSPLIGSDWLGLAPIVSDWLQLARIVSGWLGLTEAACSLREVLTEKVPRGFENFFPKDIKNAEKEEGEGKGSPGKGGPVSQLKYSLTYCIA